MNRSDINFDNLNKHVQTTIFRSNAEMVRTIEALNEAGVDPATAAIDFILTGFGQVDAALPEVQFNILALAEKKIRQHRTRLEGEGHRCDELWPELMELD